MSEDEATRRAIRRVVQAGHGSDLEDLEDRVARLEAKLDRVDEAVDSVKELSARLDGQTTILVRAYEHVTAQAAAQTTSAIELARAKEIAAVNDAADEKKQRRALRLKLVACVTGLLPLLAAGLSRC